jgi:hypothetical protein
MSLNRRCHSRPGRHHRHLPQSGRTRTIRVFISVAVVIIIPGRLGIYFRIGTYGPGAVPVSLGGLRRYGWFCPVSRFGRLQLLRHLLEHGVELDVGSCVACDRSAHFWVSC